MNPHPSLRRREAVAALAAAFCVMPPARAQAWPAKPIRLIVPSPTGGGTDGLSRLVSAKLAEMLQWQFVVENKPGAGGNLGMDAAAKAAPDGYTLVMGESSNLLINPALYKRMPFDPAKDVVPVALAGTVPLVLVVASHRPYNSLPSLVVASRIAAQQGKPLVFASSGNGTVGHLVGEMWQRRTGAPWLHVPYKGAGPVMTDLLGGQVDMHFASLPAAIPLVKSGKLRALGVTSEKRAASLPEVPTLAELGFERFVYSVMYGLMAPAGTPKAIVGKVNAEVNRALEAADLKVALAERGVEVKPGSPEQFGAFLAAERKKWAEAVRASGATVD